MPPRTHSILAPSCKEWFHCGLAAKFLAVKGDDDASEAAQFGTEAHALAEAYIIQSLKLTPYEPSVGLTPEAVKASLKLYSQEMEHLASAYANFVVDTVGFEAKRTGEQPVVLVEQYLEMDYAPDTHGTLDCCIIAGDTLTVIDNKTGFIKVTAEEDGELNSQLAIYGLYAYKCYRDIYPIKQVRLVVYQERIHNISEITVSAEQLEAWEREKLIPAAKNALSDNPKSASGWWCKYCPGRAICRRRSEDAFAAVGDMKKPELMTDAEIEQVLPKLDGVIDYAEAVKEYALKKAVEQGRRWSGFKLVESTTKRKISDEEAVGKILTEAGFSPFTQKLLSITDMQKMVGKKKLDELVGGYIVKPQGQPVLVPEGDSRTEIFIKKETK
ncbi:MAG: DUF2800 domain-containing protein [Lachnospiraceae bacterium]|nr:DUF2800 domain-containing protein [Lachnospiraceae bacterium]